MFHYTKAVLRAAPSIFVTYFFYLKRWAKNIAKYPRELRFSKLRQLSKKIVRALNIELNVFGLENLPTDSNFFLVSNHMSICDPLPYIVSHEKPVAFVGKIELLKTPFVPAAMKVIESDFIDRDNLRQSLKVMLKVEEDLKKHEKSWMIFPEGTRIRDQLMRVAEFHHGTFRPAIKANVPIVPAAIYGSFRVLKKKPQFKKYPVSVSFLKPLTPEEYQGMNTSDVAALLRDNIQREITYHLRPLDHKIMSESKDKSYRFTQVL